jgi:hypothetical protein
MRRVEAAKRGVDVLVMRSSLVPRPVSS